MNTKPQFELAQEFENSNPQETAYTSGVDDLCEIRCRFCYESSKPLISVCACTGSIQYVHEQCILNWIQKKLEIAEALQIPACELCQQRFHAQMKIGRKQLSLNLLVSHIKLMGNKELGQGIIHAIMFLACLITILVSLNILYHDVVNYNFFPDQIQPLGNKPRTTWQLLQFVFTNIVVQLYGIGHFILFIKSKQKWLEDSMVQVVEVLLQPRLVRKQ